jgi:predicted dehydrogenase
MAKTVLVLGCGSIGRRHIKNLKALGRRVIAYDPDPKRLDWARRNLGCETISDPRRALNGKLEAAWICTPPHLHARGARPFLRHGIPCFIEKPLAHKSADARALAALGKRVGVGYMLRRVPALLWLKKNLDAGRWGKLLHLRAFAGQYLPDWRPWQDYRKSYTAKRGQGGGVLLDCSHELDLARWLAGEVRELYCRAEKLSALKISAHDTAEVVLGFKSGAMGSVHLDMISRGPRRGLELLLSEATVVWDMPTARLEIYTPRTKRWTAKRFPFKVNELYVQEAKAFLSGSRKIVSAADAVKTLTLVEAAERSARARKMVRVK